MPKRDYYFNGIGLIEPEESGDAVLVELQNPTENAWARIPSSQIRDLAFKLLLASQDTARRRNDQTQTVTPAQHLRAALSGQMPEHCIVIVEIAEGMPEIAFGLPTAELVAFVDAAAQLPRPETPGPSKIN
ncbi:hypothetical protein [Mesorhizobium delmotii]|uniref:Uncharacterized protein n=1 Tax=Mesorhizobium delmotii TaxID=1631247 RepID=A0A2P9AH22_9HYPH|nr:hypothetical protein [Mesorhizobium delmotii]SJM30424.1 hypothetical protein BQ8482_150011 [Mesorhizobium delmotii]